MTADEYIKTHWEKNEIWRNNQATHHVNRLSKCAGLVEGARFIDVGCGLGHSTDSLHSWHPGDWSGLDFSAHAVDVAKNNFPEIPFYFSPDFTLLPICGVFDSVVCSEVIEHVPDDEALIDGLLDITKEKLIMTTPCRRVGDPGHLRLYDEVVLHRLLKDLNYTLEKDPTFFYIIITKE